jgi:hypothetical protein
MSLGKKRKPAASEDDDVSPQRKPAASEDHDDYLLRAGMLRAGASTSSDKKRKPAASDDGDGEHDMRADTANRKGSKKGGKGSGGKGSGGKGSGGKGSSGGSFGDVLKKALQQPRHAAVGSAAKGNVELKKRIKTEKVAREEKKILLEKRKWFQKEHVLPVRYEPPTSREETSHRACVWYQQSVVLFLLCSAALPFVLRGCDGARVCSSLRSRPMRIFQ